jgi:hypothetical protein
MPLRIIAPLGLGIRLHSPLVLQSAVRKRPLRCHELNLNEATRELLLIASALASDVQLFGAGI